MNRTKSFRQRTALAIMVLVVGALSLTPLLTGVGASTTAQYTSPIDPTVTYAVPTSVVHGSDIVISGSGWLHSDGVGSAIAVLLDAEVSGDPNTVLTTREVVNPLTGVASSDKRLHVIVEADATGAWTASVPFPTADNSSAGVTTPVWEAGSTHHVRLLTGSLRPGDQPRSLTARSNVVSPEPTTTTSTVPATTSTSTTSTTTSTTTTSTTTTTVPVDPGVPTWPFERIDVVNGEHTTTAWIERNINAGAGSTMRIVGTGWVNQSGNHGSTIAIKVNKGGGEQYTRSGSDIVPHPSAGGNDTIWVLLDQESSTHPNVYPILSDGSFEIEIDMPSLTAGQYLSVQFQSGRFLDGDHQRSIATAPLVIGGVPWVDDEDGGEDIACHTDLVSPTVQIHDTSVGLGDQVRITGAGWCHPSNGGSVVAVKINEGAFSRVDSSIHQNRTIWQVFEAHPETGTFDTLIDLPDGTDATSEPAMTPGAYTFRLLSGTLKANDTVRSMLSDEFVVGAYQPSGTPSPPEVNEDLHSGTRNGVVITKTTTTLGITLPGQRVGDWVFVTVFDGSSPRYPWGPQWFQLQVDQRLDLPLAGITLPAGKNKVAVHSDARTPQGGRVLLGWDYITVAAPPTTTTTIPRTSPTTTVPSTQRPVTPPSTRPASGQGAESPNASRRNQSSANPSVNQRANTSPSRAADSSTQLPAPTHTPGEPASTSNGLKALDQGSVTADITGAIVTISLPDAASGDWVFVYVYSDPTPAGWLRVSSTRTVSLDLSAFENGEHALAVIDSDDSLIGWTTIDLDAGVSSTQAAALDTPVESADATSTESAASTSTSSSPQGSTNWNLILFATAIVVGVGTGGFAYFSRRSSQGQSS